MKISPDHPALPGHFPGNPVVPGVVILDEVCRAVRHEYGAESVVREFPQVKFLSPLLPGQEFSISLTLRSPGRIAFEVAASDGRRVVSGSLMLREADVTPPGSGR